MDNHNSKVNDNVIFGKNAVLEVLSSDTEVDTVFISIVREDKFYGKVAALCKKKGAVLKNVQKSKIDRLCYKMPHQGIAAFVGDFQYAELRDVAAKKKAAGERLFVVMCDGIEDPHNLGAVIRTAECAGASAVIIGERRSAQINSTVVKSSAGAVLHIPIVRAKNLNNTIKELKELGAFVYGAEADGDDYLKTDFSGNICLVIGSEGFGMSKLVAQNCDVILSLPMRGKVNSLNASVAAGILIYRAIQF